MAEPAWGLHVRRASTRRRVARGRAPAWLRPGRSADWLRRAWLLWLARQLKLPFADLLAVARMSSVERAARGARAALEDAPPLPRPPGAPLRAHPPGAGLRIPSPVTLPLRYAAHLAATLLVVVIILAAGDGASAGVLQLGSAVQSVQAPVAAEQSDATVRLKSSFALSGAESGMVVPALRVPQPSAAPAFIESHQLSEGETLGAVAARYRVSVASLFWANDLDRDAVLAIGQELRIPRLSGIPHVIQPGETIDSIAALFQVQPAAIALFKANGVREDRPLPVGREIFIPGGTLAYPDELLARYGGESGIASMSAVLAGVVQEAETNMRAGPGQMYQRLDYLDAGRRLRLIARHDSWVKVDAGAGDVGWVRADLLGLSDATVGALAETNDFPPPPPRWVWPTYGTLTSPFGWRMEPYRSFHDGLDIANSAGTRIRAARAGQVIEAGWCSGFGYCVKIDHGDGMVSIYGHMLKQPSVKVGASVDAGDPIGLMGSSFDRSGGGYSTGVHLHFTIKVNGKAVNPLKFLP